MKKLVVTNRDVIKIAALIKQVELQEISYEVQNIKSFIAALKSETKDNCFNANFQSYLRSELNDYALEWLEKLFLTENRYHLALQEYFFNAIGESSPFYEAIHTKKKVEMDWKNLEELLLKLYKKIDIDKVCEERDISSSNTPLSGIWLGFSSLSYLEEKGKEEVAGKKQSPSDVILQSLWLFEEKGENPHEYKVIRYSNKQRHSANEIEVFEDGTHLLKLKRKDKKATIFFGEFVNKAGYCLMKLSRIREHRRKSVLIREILIKIEDSVLQEQVKKLGEEEDISKLSSLGIYQPKIVSLYQNFLKEFGDKISEYIKIEGIRKFISRPFYLLNDIKYEEKYEGLRGVWKVYTWLDENTLSECPMFIYSSHCVKYKVKDLQYANGVIRKVADNKLWISFTTSTRCSFYILDHKLIGDNSFADIEMIKGSFLLSGANNSMTGGCLFIKEDTNGEDIEKQFQDFQGKYAYEQYHCKKDILEEYGEGLGATELEINQRKEKAKLLRKVLALLPRPALKLEQLPHNAKKEIWEILGEKYQDEKKEGAWFE
ncbi:MAG: hypothetical protein ACKVTZ_13070, partial [Bacteroidia bacterium]